MTAGYQVFSVSVNYEGNFEAAARIHPTVQGPFQSPQIDTRKSHRLIEQYRLPKSHRLKRQTVSARCSHPSTARPHSFFGKLSKYD